MADTLPLRQDRYLVLGDGADFAAVSTSGDWPATTRLIIESAALVEASFTPILDGLTATWALTVAQVTALVGTKTSGVLRYRVTVGSGDQLRGEIAGFLSIKTRWDAARTVQSLGTVVVGPAGPTAVSADVGNAAELGTDGLIFVPPAGPTAVSADVGNAAELGTDGLIFVPPAGLDTEAVQDVVGTMVAAAGGSYSDGDGSIALPAPYPLQTLTLTSNATLNIDANWPTDQAVGYIVTQDLVGGWTLTLGAGLVDKGVTINPATSASTILILLKVAESWWCYQAGVGAPTPAMSAPAVGVSSVTSTSITVTYSTATPGAIVWQYRLNGGASSALDGTSPDVIGGLSPLQSGTIEVRYSSDAAAWSPWSAPTAWQTAALTLAPLRLPATANITETWDGTNWVYTWTNNASPVVLMGAAGQDCQLVFRVASVGNSTLVAAISGTISTTNYQDGDWGINGPMSISIKTDGTWNEYGGAGFSAPYLNYTAGIMFRLVRTGTIWTIETSSDSGVTWILRQSENRGQNSENAILYISGTSGWVIDRIQSAVLGTALTVVTADGPVGTRYAGGGSDTLTIPTVTGVTYTISGTPAYGTYTVPSFGSTVTVIPVPQAGYCLWKNLLAATGWVYTFGTGVLPADATLIPAPATVLTSDSFNRSDGAPATSDVAYGGVARSWSIAAPTAISSNQLVVSGNGASITGWTASVDMQVEWDYTSAGATKRVEVGSVLTIQVSDNTVSLWYEYQQSYGVNTRLVIPLSGTAPTGRWAALIKGRVVTIMGPSGVVTKQFILPLAISAVGTVTWKASTRMANWGLLAQVGVLTVDNIKIGVPA